MSNIDKEIKQMENIDFELVKEYLPDSNELSKYLRKWLLK